MVEIESTDIAFETRVDCGVWQPVPTAIFGGPRSQFTDGVWRVGIDILPGLYVAASVDCYWARRSGLTDDFDEILANGNPQGRMLLQVLPSDLAVETSRCGPLTFVGSGPPAPLTAFGPGSWRVGIDIEPGTYQTTRASVESCSWSRRTGFTGDFAEVTQADLIVGQATVTIAPDDVGFEASQRCGGWRLVTTD